MPKLEQMKPRPPDLKALEELPGKKREIEVLGSFTSYWEYGPSDARWLIVAAHGYRGEHHGLEPVIAHLPGVRVIVPDMPGFGESSPLTEAPHSIAGYADWLEAFLDQLHVLGKAVLLGHSFGSIIASQAVSTGLNTPGMILMNPIAISGVKGPKRFSTWLTVKFYRTAAKLPERLAKRMLGNWAVVQFMSVILAKTKDRALRKWIHQEHHRYFNNFSDSRTVSEAFEASVSQNVGDVAEKIGVPTLLIAAELDDITPISANYALAKTIPNAKIVVLEGVGHLIHYEQPELAAEAITEFLNGLGSQ